ncbi:DUF6261 family protein [uncultured Acetobacteroides sp.]|uniref:DUF6261 family protein n=1 Tax=uncultured Acetobacteroides sp. TaxID=1760811 RepID=UPI0029F53767|nr:DUF6261 family protein [uncultured Acetobacteroides sp.]
MTKLRLSGNPSRNLGNLDFYQFVTDQATRIRGLGDAVLTDADLRQLVVVLLALAADFSKTILRVQKSLKTEEIMRRKRARDICIAALRSGVRNARYAINPREVSASSGLAILLGTYGDIAHQAMEKGSGTIDKLLGELEGDTYRPLFEVLGLAAKVFRLKDENDAFKAIFESRRSDGLAKDGVRALDVRRQFNRQYQQLCDYVLLQAKITGGEQYLEALQLINAIRKEYLEKVARHKAAKKGRGNPAADE